jgi:hypothetical protein
MHILCNVGVNKALVDQALIHVVVSPPESIDNMSCQAVFDPNTLGSWRLIPEPYRVYWAFKKSCGELADKTDSCSDKQGLYNKIDSYIHQTDLPVHVGRAMNRLRLKAALLTSEQNRIARSVQADIVGLCNNQFVSKYHCLLELARCNKEIQRHSAELADKLLPSLVEQVVRHVGQEAIGNLEKLTPTLNRNNWLPYGERLLKEIESQDLADKERIAQLADTFTSMRLVRQSNSPDPVEASGTVKKYLELLDAVPAQGTIYMTTLRSILDEGLRDCYSPSESQAKHQHEEHIIQLICQMVGKGPFQGDQVKLIDSIKQFAGAYKKVFNTVESMDTTLAVFLALSFCNISTQEDHERLLSQYHTRSSHLESQVDTMLAARQLDGFISPQEVRTRFGSYEEMFASYVHDPLWPTLKYPLTNHEETLITNKLKIRFGQLSALLDDIGIRVKYGAQSDELKRKTMAELSFAIEEIMISTAFLRIPEYPGIGAGYQGQHGLSVAIEGRVFNAERPRDFFKAMKYFHVGDYLLQTVRDETQRLEERP